MYLLLTLIVFAVIVSYVFCKKMTKYVWKPAVEEDFPERLPLTAPTHLK